MKLLFLFILAYAAKAKPCLTKNPNFRSVSVSADEEGPASIRFVNHGFSDMTVAWVNYDGQEVVQGVLSAQGGEPHNSFIGHAFRISKYDGSVVLEHIVRKNDEEVDVYCCGTDAENALFDPGRDKEFEALVITKECQGVSSQWSCTRHVPRHEVDARDPAQFGFLDSEVRGSRFVGQIKDDSYVSHISKIPHLTKEGGYLHMRMTDHMIKSLLPWYRNNTKELKNHEPVAGDYLNVHAVPIDKLNLDSFPEVRHEVIKEMQQVLQWWTNKQLKHTSTFGVRVYRRGSMLINHVDRHDTHLASAVIQVHQQVDEDGGWPLELLGTTGETYEVYLQPGEMVLYEGARLFHGRPMRFAGDEFANVFSHFAPVTWKFGAKHDEL